MKLHRVLVAAGAALMLAATAHAVVTPVFFFKWGSAGGGPGQFSFPTGVAIAPSGDVYVVDQLNYRVQEFNPTGGFVNQFGSPGSGDGQFLNPTGLGIDGSGNVYVADSGNNRVQKFSPSGAFLMKFGSLGSGNGQFRTPYDVAVNSSGDIYVTDGQNGRVQHFTSAGTYVSQFGQADLINTPRGIAINSNGIYVCDYGDDFIVVYDEGSETLVNAWGGNGSANGFFSAPQGINLDVLGNVYTAEVNNRRVQIFDASGNFLTKFGTSGSSDGQFNVLRDACPDGAMDPKVYCADSNNQRIQAFGDPVTATGNTTWGRLKALYVK
ncbi:MAG TPA: hypothetical protein VMJ70_09190 [Candidatus Sulfotelmatobacter sp.]|nr:hypothetical protein [Candidatus Sulfotelmatobacter sp.]